MKLKQYPMSICKSDYVGTNLYVGGGGCVGGLVSPLITKLNENRTMSQIFPQTLLKQLIRYIDVCFSVDISLNSV